MMLNAKNRAAGPAIAAVGVVVGIGPGTGAPPVGPAPGDRHVWLEVGDSRMRALIAVAAPYQPTVGDRVVVVGTDDARFVVGVVEQQEPSALQLSDGSRAQLDADGALEVHDADGVLRVRYDGSETTIKAASGDLVLDAPGGGVVVRAKTEVRVEAPRIRFEAEQIYERTRESIREVSSLLLTRAGRIRTLVREGFSLKSKRTHIKSENDTSIDGKRILLG